MFNTGKRPSKKGKDALPIACGPAVQEEFTYMHGNMFRRHGLSVLPLVAKDAPVRTSQIRYKYRDDYRG
jgi:hypothetical protein